jgi:hypothetical protein
MHPLIFFKIERSLLRIHRIGWPSTDLSCSNGVYRVAARSQRPIARYPQEVLVKEDYAQAAVLRDKINELMAKDPILQLKTRLQDAINDENYLVWPS